ncbi:MAG: hypothetical protein HOO96_27050, partial [Polyangiaceae bacterium]|nr:hypothetical protein [Polyangiaceae bacterium]
MVRRASFVTFALMALAHCGPARPPGDPTTAEVPPEGRPYVAVLHGGQKDKGPVIEDLGERPASVQTLAEVEWSMARVAELRLGPEAQREVDALVALVEHWRSKGGDELVLVRDAKGEWSRPKGAAAVARALAPIDTPARANLVARFSGHAISQRPDGQPNFRQTREGFEFDESESMQEPSYACKDPDAERRAPVVRFTLLIVHVVRRDGTIAELRREEQNREESMERCHPHPRGRAPEGFVVSCFVPGSFADAAHYEAASVAAFRQLAADLRAHGAPEELALRAEVAAADEVRHAEIMHALARRYEDAEAPASPERVTTQPPRALLAIALENVREGCVREAFAALETLHQAQNAGASEVREALAPVAADELAHAELAFAVHDWVASRLGPAERE